MNMTNDGARYGFTQYCYPKDFELSGRSFTLRSGEKAWQLDFIDDGFIESCDGVAEKILSRYEALKLDDTTHIAFFGEYITVAVLDLAAGCAVISDEKGKTYDFCTIEGRYEGAEMPSYTDEMAGTRVRWFFGCERYLENEYHADGTCTCIWSPRTNKPRRAPARYIRLKDTTYLCQVDAVSPFRTDIPQGYSKIVMLQDYDRLQTVGCVYSPVLNDWKLISGYAMPPED